MTQPKTTVNPTPANKIPDFFENLGNKGLLFALLLISAIAFFVFKDFLLLNKLFLFKDIGSDTINGMFPHYYNYANYLQNVGMPKWSFVEGMGQSIMSGFLRDPFQLIPMLIGPQSMPKIFIYIEVSKIIIGGGIFYLFLKSIRISNYAAIIGSVLFSFCGFMIIGACWYYFTYEALTVAILLLGFEKLYQNKKWILFAFGIFLTAISMPVNIYIFGVFIAFYAAFRFLQENKFDAKKLIGLYIQLLLAGGVGILIAGPFFLENLYTILESPRGSGTDSYFSKLSGAPMFGVANKVEFGSSVMRMFSNDIIGTGNTFTGVQNFLEAPFSYCGLISLLLMTQVFPFVDKSVRRWYIVLLAIWLIPTIFPYFRYAFWLFSGDYFRAYSFFVSLVFILFSVYALDLILKHKKVNIIALVATLGFWLMLSALKYKATVTYPTGQQAVQELKTDDAIAIFTKIFLLAYAGIIFFLGRSKNTASLKYVLLGLVAFEAIYLSQFSTNSNRRNIVQTGELKEKVGYNDYSVEAVNYIKSKEKGFYRIDKTYSSGGAMHGSITDQKVHNYYSTSSYNSFSQMNFINYMRAYDVIDKNSEYSSRWVNGLTVRPLPILQSLNNVKYVMTKSRSYNPYWTFTYDSVAKFGDVVVLKNKFDLPFGYTYDKYITQAEFNSLTTMQKDFVSLKAIVLDEKALQNSPGLKKFNLKDTVPVNLFNWDMYKVSVDSLKQEAMTTTLFSENKIDGTINTSANRVMYLSFPFDKGWHLKVDGKDADLFLVSNGMTGVYLPKGNHTVSLEYRLKHFTKGFVLMIIGLLLSGGLWFYYRKKNTVTVQ